MSATISSDSSRQMGALQDHQIATSPLRHQLARPGQGTASECTTKDVFPVLASMKFAGLAA
jgi:hypothetical protein